MSDWPNSLVLPDPMTAIGYASTPSLSGVSGNLGTPASAVWPLANRAIFVPFRLSRSIVAVKLFIFNGTVVSGNVDVGLYDEFGTKLVSKGSTAQAGTSALQAFDITDTRLGPGLFYLAVALDTGTGTLFRAALAVQLLRVMGCAQMASAFALPAAATLATVSSAYLPVAGLSTRVTL